MRIYVHVRDQMFSIECGSATQKIMWLSDVALHRYEHFFGVDPGLSKGMRYENGDQINVEKLIIDELEEDSHVWVLLKEDISYLNQKSAE